MAKILTKAVRGKETAAPARIEMPRRVRLGTVLVRAKQALREVMLSAGTDVLMAMLEDDRTALCGPPASRDTRIGTSVELHCVGSVPGGEPISNASG
jgi:hypothetical protein